MAKGQRIIPLSNVGPNGEAGFWGDTLLGEEVLGWVVARKTGEGEEIEKVIMRDEGDQMLGYFGELKIVDGDVVHKCER